MPIAGLILELTFLFLRIQNSAEMSSMAPHDLFRSRVPGPALPLPLYVLLSSLARPACRDRVKPQILLILVERIFWALCRNRNAYRRKMIKLASLNVMSQFFTKRRSLALLQCFLQWSDLSKLFLQTLLPLLEGFYRPLTKSTPKPGFPNSFKTSFWTLSYGFWPILKSSWNPGLGWFLSMVFSSFSCSCFEARRRNAARIDSVPVFQTTSSAASLSVDSENVKYS